MAYDFLDYLKPVGSATFSLLEDLYLKGGFRTVATADDLNNIDPSAIKLGMWVAVDEEDGKIYECTEYGIVEDEFGDTSVNTKFEALDLDGVEGVEGEKVVREHVRSVKKVNFSYDNAGDVVDIPVDMGCKSFVIVGLRISAGRIMRLRLFSNMNKTDVLPYEFVSDRLNFDNGVTYLKNGTKFQYKKYHVAINESPVPSDRNIFLFECTSLEDPEFVFDRELEHAPVEIVLTYIPLET